MSTLQATPATAATVPTVSPSDAAALVRAGKGWIVDVREVDEYKREHVAGSSLGPTTVVTPAHMPAPHAGKTMLVMCRSGARATRVAEAMRALGREDVAVLQGGIVGWEKAGLPVERGASAPLPLMRQVMITVGTLLLGMTALAVWVNPWWVLGAGAMGAGLLFAGLTGICALAALLSVMPWNR